MIYLVSVLSLLVLSAYSQCASISVSGIPSFPLDACFATVSVEHDIEVSYKYFCENGTAMHAFYNNSNCSGDPATAESLDVEYFGFDEVDCSADPCSFAEIRVDLETTNGSSYNMFGSVVDECYDYMGTGLYMMASCDSEDGVVTHGFMSDDCSGDPIPSASITATIFNASDSCNTITCPATQSSTGEPSQPTTSEDVTGAHAIDCNHAVLDEEVMIVDVCVSDGSDSQMVVCRDGHGFLRRWELDANCEGNHAFEGALADWDTEVVCDVSPCLIAVFEVYHSSDSGDWNVSEDTGESARRLQDSDSCDYSSTPEVAAFIVDSCVAIDEAESVVITCTGTHDAMVSHFANDNEHECGGSATTTASANDYFGDMCGMMVACNVYAGADFVMPTRSLTGSPTTEPTVLPTAAPTEKDGAYVPFDAVFGSLLAAVGFLLTAS